MLEVIIGNRSAFAIESEISKAYSRLSLLALGYFVIYIRGFCYGARRPDATMLACSFDTVKKIIAFKTKRTVELADSFSAGDIADAFRVSVYGAKSPSKSIIELAGILQNADGDYMWAPDGDAAFDDGSYVLYFDDGVQVRLIGFRCSPDGLHDPTSINEVWLDSEGYYNVLEDWRDTFHAEWDRFPKSD